MRKVEIEIPDGKMAQWVNGVLTLVDDKKPQNVMERIKTFEDAVVELSNRAMNGDKDAGKLLDEWKIIISSANSKDLLAYLKLRIITYALNEGWKPKFEEVSERRYYPWFDIDARKLLFENRRVGSLELTNYGANGASSYSHAGYSSRLAFKSKELAEYAGKQFIDIYADFCFI